MYLIAKQQNSTKNGRKPNKDQDGSLLIVCTS